MKRPSIAARTIAVGLASVSMLVAATAPALARRHAEPAPAAQQQTAPRAGEPLAQAIPRLEQALAARPNDPVTAAQLSDLYLQAGRADLALAVTSKLINSGQRTAGLLYFAGMSYRALNQPANSLAALQQAELADPTSGSILMALTDAYLQAGRMDDALREAKRDATFNKGDARAHLNFGVTLALAKQLDAARAEFGNAHVLSPGDARPMILSGRTFLDSGDPVNAMANFNAALALNQNNTDALNGKAAAFALGKDVPSAINTLEQVLAQTPDPQAKVAIMVEEARLLVANKQAPVAEQSLLRGIKAFPQLASTHIAYGDFLAAVGRPQEAQKEWMTAAGPKADNRDALLRLGGFAMGQNKFTDAVAAFSRVVAVAPNDDAGYVNLGQALLSMKDVGHASEAFRKAFSIRRSPDALAGLATCDYATKNYKEAMQIFDALNTQASQYVAQNPRLLFTMGRTYDLTNQKDRARSAYRQLLAVTRKDSSEEKMVRGLLARLDGGASPAARPAAVKSSGKANH